MRVSSCKFLRPPFVCFSKSSVGHYPPSTLELEDAQHVCASPAPVPDTSAELPSEEKIEVEKVDDVKVEMIMKSSFKKTDSGLNGVAKGRVKWMDFVGKELVEVKEFDASDSGDSDDDTDGNRGCFCTIQ